MSWNQPNKSQSTHHPQKRNRKAAFWAFVIVLAIAAVSVRLSRRSEEVPHEHEKLKPHLIQHVSQSGKTSVSNDARSMASVESSNDKQATNETWLGQSVVRHDIKTNTTLIVETIYTADGMMHKYYHDTREDALPTGPDQILAMMTAEDGGFGAPPLPMVSNFEHEFVKAIKTPIEIKEDDPADVKELKKRVITARQEMLDLMAQGLRAEDVIREYERVQEANATIRLDAVRAVKEFIDEGDRDGAEALCQKYNKVLEKAGIMPIELPNKE